MRHFCFAVIISTILTVALFASSKDDSAVAFVKTLIQKSLNGESGYLDALRYFQYTSTTLKNNPYSYVLSPYGKSALKESGIQTSDKGIMLSALKDRSGKRIRALWEANKAELLKMFPAPGYNKILKSEVDSLVTFHDSPDYNKLMSRLKSVNPKPGVNTIEKAGAVTEWNMYRELSFWHRRAFEKNDAAVYAILKELQDYYK